MMFKRRSDNINRKQMKTPEETTAVPSSRAIGIFANGYTRKNSKGDGWKPLVVETTDRYLKKMRSIQTPTTTFPEIAITFNTFGSFFLESCCASVADKGLKLV